VVIVERLRPKPIELKSGYLKTPQPLGKFALHPLIHTSVLVNLAHSIVAGSQKRKCGLKYVIHTQSE